MHEPETILNSSAAIASIISGIAAIVSIIQAFKSKKHRIAVENAEQNVLKKIKAFDTYKVLINAKNLETKLNDWVSSQKIKRGLNREDMCKSIQHLLSLINEVIPKLDESSQLNTQIEATYKTISDTIADFAKYNDSNDEQSIVSAQVLLENIRIIIRIFSKLLSYQ